MKEITDRRYPNGQFEYGKNYSIDETRKHIKSLARLPKDLKKILKKLRDGALDKSYRAGGWTARQVIHHIADSHMNAYVRFKLAATETAPIIKPYEENLWAETEDAKHGSPKTSLKLLAALHIRWVDFLMSLSEDDLDRGYYHPASKRTVSLREAIALYAWHSKHHLAHIKLVADGSSEKASDTKALAPEKAKGTKAGNKSIAIVSIEADGQPKKRVMSEAHKDKIRAAQQSRRAAEKSTKPVVATAASVASAPKKRGRPATKPAEESQERGTPVNTSRSNIKNVQAAAPGTAKRGRPSSVKVADAKAAKPVAEKTAVAKGKPGRKPNPEVAAAKAAKAAAPKLSRAEILAKARAAAAANRAAAGKPAAAPEKAKPGRPSSAKVAVTKAAKPVAQKAPTEKGKPGRKPNPEAAAAKAAKAAAPKLSRAEVMEKARAAAAANRAAKALTAPKKVVAEKGKPGRKADPAVAAAKAAKAAEPKLSRAEVMEKARAAAAANRAAKAAAAPKKVAPETPKRARRSAEEVAAEKAAKAAAPKLSRAEVMEKARAAAAANRAAKGQPAKPKKDPNAPKLTREEALAKARLARTKK